MAGGILILTLSAANLAIFPLCLVYFQFVANI